jgi:hypothetical protein
MNGTTRLSQRVAYWSAILTGVLFLYWGGGAAVVPQRVLAPATVAWGEQIVAAMSQHVWLPAVGILLLVVGLFPALAQQVRGNRLAQFGVGLGGLGLIGAGGGLLAVPASALMEGMYLAPLFAAGLLLVGLVLPG